MTPKSAQAQASTPTPAQTKLSRPDNLTIRIRANGKIGINWDALDDVANYQVYYEGHRGDGTRWRGWTQRKSKMQTHSYSIVPRSIIPDDVQMLYVWVRGVDKDGKKGRWSRRSPALFLKLVMDVSKNKRTVTFGWPSEKDAESYELEITGTTTADPSTPVWKVEPEVEQPASVTTKHTKPKRRVTYTPGVKYEMTRGCREDSDNIQSAERVVARVRSVSDNGKTRGDWSDWSAEKALPKTPLQEAAEVELVNIEGSEHLRFTFGKVSRAASYQLELFGRLNPAADWVEKESGNHNGDGDHWYDFGVGSDTQVYGRVEYLDSDGNQLACAESDIYDVPANPLG